MPGGTPLGSERVAWPALRLLTLVGGVLAAAVASRCRPGGLLALAPGQAIVGDVPAPSILVVTFDPGAAGWRNEMRLRSSQCSHSHCRGAVTARPALWGWRQQCQHVGESRSQPPGNPVPGLLAGSPAAAAAAAALEAHDVDGGPSAARRPARCWSGRRGGGRRSRLGGEPRGRPQGLIVVGGAAGEAAAEGRGLRRGQSDHVSLLHGPRVAASARGRRARRALALHGHRQARTAVGAATGGRRLEHTE